VQVAIVNPLELQREGLFFAVRNGSH